MRAKTGRQILRRVHLIPSVPILGFIDGPVADQPRAAFATRYVFVPIVALSGLWMWKGHAVRRRVFGLRPSAAERVGNCRDR
jgi:thiosulfate reductase cytochrome b subunit